LSYLYFLFLLSIRLCPSFSHIISFSSATLVYALFNFFFLSLLLVPHSNQRYTFLCPLSFPDIPYLSLFCNRVVCTGVSLWPWRNVSSLGGPPGVPKHCVFKQTVVPNSRCAHRLPDTHVPSAN
jgi:hypothetical protein